MFMFNGSDNGFMNFQVAILCSWLQYDEESLFKDKSNRPYDPCEMTKHTHKHYTMT